MIDPNGGRVAALQRTAASSRARRNRSPKGTPRTALGCQRDGNPLPDFRARRCPQHRLVQFTTK